MPGIFLIFHSLWKLGKFFACKESWFAPQKVREEETKMVEMCLFSVTIIVFHSSYKCRSTLTLKVLNGYIYIICCHFYKGELLLWLLVCISEWWYGPKGGLLLGERIFSKEQSQKSDPLRREEKLKMIEMLLPLKVYPVNFLTHCILSTLPLLYVGWVHLSF